MSGAIGAKSQFPYLCSMTYATCHEESVSYPMSSASLHHIGEERTCKLMQGPTMKGMVAMERMESHKIPAQKEGQWETRVSQNIKLPPTIVGQCDQRVVKKSQKVDKYSQETVKKFLSLYLYIVHLRKLKTRSYGRRGMQGLLKAWNNL